MILASQYMHSFTSPSQESTQNGLSRNDTDTSLDELQSPSHSTAKKIKQFIHKRRKSSGSSNEIPPFPPHLSPPPSEPNPTKASRRGSVTLSDILSGDEGNIDGERGNRHVFGAPETHDCQDSYNGESSQTPEQNQKRR